jgi:excisionase family DNA binding protein
MEGNNNFERRWFGVHQAADYVGCTVRAIREAIWSGELPRSRVGRRFIVSRADLDSLLEARMQREIDPNKGRKRA